MGKKKTASEKPGKTSGNVAILCSKAKLWLAADKLRNNQEGLGYGS